jgi:hypothetical protein
MSYSPDQLDRYGYRPGYIWRNSNQSESSINACIECHKNCWLLWEHRNGYTLKRREGYCISVDISDGDTIMLALAWTETGDDDDHDPAVGNAHSEGRSHYFYITLSWNSKYLLPLKKGSKMYPDHLSIHRFEYWLILRVKVLWQLNQSVYIQLLFK